MPVPRQKVSRSRSVIGRSAGTACVRRRREPGDGVVEVADQAGGAAEVAVIAQQVELAGPGGRAGDEGQDLAPALVDAQWAGRAIETSLVEVGEQGVHGRCPGASRAAHGVTNPDDSAAHVAAAQRRLGACHRLAAP
jgi:hypothetical protein